MALRSLFVIAALFASAVFAPVATAQSAASDSSTAVRQDSVPTARPHQLAPVVIVAGRDKVGILEGIAARSEITALVRENRALQRQLAQHDQQIERLEDRLERLQQLETRMLDQIAGLDSATAATRAQRERLEARLQAAQESGTVVRGRDKH